MNIDWKKEAATQMANQDVEKAFLDQAYLAISNKAQPIMKSPYRLGFEIVKKNDANTRMVGIFVFRIGKNLLYAPVFFINGNIKGTDLLYRHKTKTFVPLTNEWVEYLLHSEVSDEGYGVDPRMRQEATPSNMDFNRIINPPTTEAQLRKFASSPEVKKLAEEAWPEIEKAAGELKGESILRKFILEDGGHDAIAKIAHAAQDNKEFCRALFYGSDPDNFMPDLEKVADANPISGGIGDKLKLKDLPKDQVSKGIEVELEHTPNRSMAADIVKDHLAEDKKYYDKLEKMEDGGKEDSKKEEEAEKKASDEGLVVHFNVLHNSNVKKASAEDIARGYVIEDTRKDASLTPHYEDAETCLQTIGEPGIYKVLMADGSMQELLIAKEDYGMLTRDTPHRGGTELISKSLSPYEKDRYPEFLMYDHDTMHVASTKREHPLYGEFVSTLDECEKMVDSMEAGKAYRVYSSKDAALSRPFYVLSKHRSDAGLDVYYISNYRSDDSSGGEVLIHNPDFEGPIDSDHVVGRFYSFIPVAFEHESADSPHLNYPGDIKPGNRSVLDDMIYSEGYKKASVVRRNDDYVVMKLAETEKWSPELTKTAARLCLMAECGLREEAADEILGKVEERKKYDFFYKQALNIRAQDYPQFYAQLNDAYGVNEEPQNLNTHALVAFRDIPLIERHRVGDRVVHNATNQDSEVANPKAPVPNEVLETATPIQLFEMSQTRGVGNLFEHGMVGSLAVTYDSISMIDKYMPDLEQGLDRIGRILFLFYWKPEDFSQAYGTDDQVDLENKLLSNFKSLGDLVLELLMKSRKDQGGSSALKS